jgi:hypothetical protein
MAITLDGTNGINSSGVIVAPDGSASAPAITNDGDTNTGIFFPAADTIAFAEGGVECARFNADAQFVAAAGTASLPVITTTGDVNTGIFFPAADTIAFAEGGAEAMRIDSSGNVGIGTSSPGSILQAEGEIRGRDGFSMQRSTGSLFLRCINPGATLTGSRSNDVSIGNQTAAPLIFHTGDTERARITSGGEVYIAGTTDQGAYNLQCNGTGVWGAGAYVNGSDERIKDDIEPIASGLDVVEKLNPVTYRYKESWTKDQSIQTGFIAQELLTALDGQVYVDSVVQQGGSEGYYSVAYQNIIPILTKALQELSAKNDALEARIAALEGSQT